MRHLFRSFSQNHSPLSSTLALPTISQALRRGVALFRDKNVPEAQLSAQYLLAHARGCSRRQLLARPKDLLSAAENAQFLQLCAGRLDRTPIQYLVGSWEFRSINLQLRKPVLIPRPETEQLVDLILDTYDSRPLTFVEVGVGSGAICLSLLQERPSWRAIGIDISSEAVELAKHNAKLLGVADRVELSVADVGKSSLPRASVSFVVSNPPYIPSEQIAALEPEVLNFEDRRALDGGQDGMDTIKTLVSQAISWLSIGDCIWLEVDLSHLLGPLQLWASSNPRVKLEQIYPDFTGRSRFCRLSVAANKEAE